MYCAGAQVLTGQNKPNDTHTKSINPFKNLHENTLDIIEDFKMATAEFFQTLRQCAKYRNEKNALLQENCYGNLIK